MELGLQWGALTTIEVYIGLGYYFFCCSDVIIFVVYCPIGSSVNM